MLVLLNLNPDIVRFEQSCIIIEKLLISGEFGLKFILPFRGQYILPNAFEENVLPERVIFMDLLV